MPAEAFPLEKMKVVLASNSPRRKELFARICPQFSVCPADADERLQPGISPAEGVRVLAERKASAVYARLTSQGETDAIVLGSDTVVSLNGAILGKPKDEKEAFDMLRLLSGKTHEVYTGVCFATRKGKRTICVCSEVVFRALTDEEICAYVATGSPMDKAGAYGIQDGAVVREYRGSYTNIVGLPVEETEKLYEEVKKDVEIGD